MGVSKIKVAFFAVVAVMLIGVGIPLAFSIANERTVLGLSETYDTRLDKQVLTPEMFADAIYTYHRYTDNPLQQILKILFERRLEVTGVERMVDGNWQYQIRSYSFFNVPKFTGWFGIGGESMLDSVKPMREF